MGMLWTLVPVPVRLAPVLADSRPADSWSGSLQHKRNSQGLGQRCPARPFLIPAAVCKQSSKI